MFALRAPAWFLCLAVVWFSFSPSLAQVLPDENHYKLYEFVDGGGTIDKLILLKDQFGYHTVTGGNFAKFAAPAFKDEYPILDPEAHQDWWAIFIPEPPRTVLVTDQFGSSLWTTFDAVYLVTPAKKYPQAGDTPPDRNHYLCYQAGGEIVGRLVVLGDQFGVQTVAVHRVKFLCTPVEKTVDGVTYKIKDPTANLACYEVINPTFFGNNVQSLDQFGTWNFILDENQCMCNPALMEGAVRTEKSTWGRIKALYH